MLKLSVSNDIENDMVNVTLIGFITSHKLDFSHWIDITGHGKTREEAEIDLDAKIVNCIDALNKSRESILYNSIEVPRTVSGRCRDCKEELMKLIKQSIEG